MRKVDSSSLTIELCLCRLVMHHYIVLDDLGESHIVSFLSLSPVFYWFHLCGFAVNVVDDHVVPVSMNGAIWNFLCLICVHDISHVVCRY